MILGSLPRRYARALVQLAQEENQLEAFGKGLREILFLLETAAEGRASFLKVLADDTFDQGERLAAIQEVAEKAGLHPLLKNFLLVLVKKERIGLLPEIVREYQRFQDDILGVVRVAVAAPAQPEPALLKRVEKILAQRLKKKIVSRGEAEPGLIGGVVLRVDHTVYDGSVHRELERMKESILRG